MDDDSSELANRLGRPLGVYGELYPSMLPRLKAILASRDPAIRRRVARLEEIVRLRSARRGHLLIERYGLTAAEARVATHLADGGDIASCAADAGVRQGTVRVQLKSVFAKTGVNRQAALVKLVRSAF